MCRANHSAITPYAWNYSVRADHVLITPKPDPVIIAAASALSFICALEGRNNGFRRARATTAPWVMRFHVNSRHYFTK